jgi:hypothetical protein
MHFSCENSKEEKMNLKEIRKSKSKRRSSILWLRSRKLTRNWNWVRISRTLRKRLKITETEEQKFMKRKRANMMLISRNLRKLWKLMRTTSKLLKISMKQSKNLMILIMKKRKVKGRTMMNQMRKIRIKCSKQNYSVWKLKGDCRKKLRIRTGWTSA